MERINRKIKRDLTKAHEIIPDSFLDDIRRDEDLLLTAKEVVPETLEASRVLEDSMIATQSYMRAFLELDVSLESPHDLDIKFAKDGLNLSQHAGKTAVHYFLGAVGTAGNITFDHRLMDNLPLLSLVAIHEFFHLFQIRTRRLALSPQLNSNDNNIVAEHVLRTGYEIKRSEKPLKMRGFNEAVTENIAREAFRGCIKTVLDEEKEIILKNQDYLVYKRERIVLDSILEAIVHTLYPADEHAGHNVWKKIARGSITGEKMHLREIAKVYGAGSLRILASMVPNTTPLSSANDLVHLYKNDDYISFFNLDNDEKKRVEAKERIVARIDLH